MALAFKRASADADAAIAKYFKLLNEKYGFKSDAPIAFDWESAKAIEGTGTFNANNEELPRSITVCKFVTGKANSFSSMFSSLAGLAKGGYEEIVWPAMRKHWSTVLVRFDDKGTTPGKCNWTLNTVKDGVLDVTMKFEFSKYVGDGNFGEIDEQILMWLDDMENIEMQVLREKVTKPGTKSHFQLNTSLLLKDKLGDAAPPVVTNWDEIAATPGRFKEVANKPPQRGSYILTKLIGEGALLSAIRYGMEAVLKDKDGKDAFAETFKEIRINVSAGDAHSLTPSKAGSTLVFTVVVDLKDYLNSHKKHDAKALGKTLETML